MKQFTVLVLMSAACASAFGAAATPSPVAALHAKTIKPASDALFQAESNPPSTAQDWEKVRVNAAALVQAASRLESKDLAKDQDQWKHFAQALKQQAEQAVAAAQKKDQDALVMANGDLISVCEDCHAKYRGR